MTDIDSSPGPNEDLPRPRPRSSLTGWTDSELLRAAARGNGDAFGEFYLRYANRILGWFRQRCGGTQDAFDLTAETFAEAFSSIGTFDSNKGVPIGWLYGIAKNVHRHYARRGAVETRARERLQIAPAQLNPDEIAQLESSIDLAALHREVAPAIAALPDSLRDAVRLRVDGLDYNEIALRLGVRPDAARKRVSRGLTQLGETLGDNPFQLP